MSARVVQAVHVTSAPRSIAHASADDADEVRFSGSIAEAVQRVLAQLPPPPPPRGQSAQPSDAALTDAPDAHEAGASGKSGTRDESGVFGRALLGKSAAVHAYFEPQAAESLFEAVPSSAFGARDLAQVAMELADEVSPSIAPPRDASAAETAMPARRTLPAPVLDAPTETARETKRTTMPAPVLGAARSAFASPAVAAEQFAPEQLLTAARPSLAPIELVAPVARRISPPSAPIPAPVTSSLGLPPPAHATNTRSPEVHARVAEPSRVAPRTERHRDRASSSTPEAPTTVRVAPTLPVAPQLVVVTPEQERASSRVPTAIAIPVGLEPSPEAEVVPAEHVRYAAIEGDHARVELSHPTFGRLDVEIRSDGGALDVTMMTRSLGASIALRAAEQSLRTELRGRTNELRAYRVRTENGARTSPRDDDEESA